MLVTARGPSVPARGTSKCCSYVVCMFSDGITIQAFDVGRGRPGEKENKAQFPGSGRNGGFQVQYSGRRKVKRGTATDGQADICSLRDKCGRSEYWLAGRGLASLQGLAAVSESNLSCAALTEHGEGNEEQREQQQQQRQGCEDAHSCVS